MEIASQSVLRPVYVPLAWRFVANPTLKEEVDLCFL